MTEAFSHIARVHLVDSTRQTQIMAALQERATYDGERDSLFLWDAEISNDLLDSHFTHMSEATLRNYVEDARAGVAFLKGHDWRSLPIGYSVSADLEEVQGKKRVVAGFYTVRGLADTDDLIARMRTGLLRDVSVGFYGGRMSCDLCGADFWDCRHFPGLKYEEKRGDTVVTELATFTIEDARLSEVSGVYDGSTPQAMILKAERSAKAGELTPEQLNFLEKKYRIALPASRIFPVPQTAPKDAPESREEEPMPQEQAQEPIARVLNEKHFQRLVDHLCIHRLMPEEDRKSVTPEEVLAYVQLTCERITKELEPQAQEGQQYRADLVEQALAEGVRAQGTEFDRALYEETLKKAPLNVIKRMRDDWKKVADKELPAGRTTTDQEERQRKPVAQPVPDAAYR